MLDKRVVIFLFVASAAYAFLFWAALGTWLTAPMHGKAVLLLSNTYAIYEMGKLWMLAMTRSKP
jgi:hypothetical protein